MRRELVGVGQCQMTIESHVVGPARMEAVQIRISSRAERVDAQGPVLISGRLHCLHHRHWDCFVVAGTRMEPDKGEHFRGGSASECGVSESEVRDAEAE